MCIAISIAIAFFAMSAGSNPTFQKHGLAGLPYVLLVLPGCIAIGAAFAFPTSAAMVFSTVALSKRWAVFDSAVAWVGAGVIFTSPTAYLFSYLQNANDRFALMSIWTLGLVIGGVAAFAAWIFRQVIVSGED
jgi:hypothetical protein